MNQDESPTLQELSKFLTEIEALAPHREQVEGTRVVYRQVETDELVEDSLPPDESALEEEPQFESPFVPEVSESPSSEARAFIPAEHVPIVCVDCGIARLGETENGTVIALRAAIIEVVDTAPRVSLFRTGPIYLHNLYKKELLYRIGQQLGKSDHFVEIDRKEPESEKILRVRAGVAFDSHKYSDRFRNWFERLAQRIAVARVSNGIVLLDGALTLRTLDTPDVFLENLVSAAHSNGNAVVAISKQSKLQVMGKPIRFWLNDTPGQACYRCLTPFMSREEDERVLGNTYAARLSALGPTFRLDIKSIEGQGDDEALSLLYGSALMRGGYPDILVQAHTHSYFTSPDVIQLQAQAGAQYQLVPQPDIDLSAIFGPFGGRFK